MPNPSTLEMARQHDTPEERLAALETSTDTLTTTVCVMTKKIDQLPDRLSEKFVSKTEFNGMRWLVRTIIAGLLAIAFSIVKFQAG